MKISVHDARTQLSRPLDRAAAAPTRRTLGRLRGKAAIRGDFDAPLPDDLLDAFEGR